MLLTAAFVFLGLLSSPEPSEVEAFLQEHQPWNDTQWIRLLHYKPTLFSGLQSEADAPLFFVSKEGKKNPKAEFRANLSAFLQPEVADPQEHPQCQFPARRKWMQNALKDLKLKWPAERQCDRYRSFTERAQSASVSLVFSSYFLNNPSSAFGHLLLRFNQQPQERSEERFELLDMGINFAAVVDTNNALVYGLKGMFGGFPGTYTAQPYYYKVRQYNDFESRDLWSYELDLTREELDRLIDHLWELGINYFDYYYLTENCAYHMLTALEAAAPRLHLVRHLPFYVIPVDSLKALIENPQLVKRIDYRPAPRVVFERRLQELSKNERESLRKILHKKDFSHLEATSMDSQVKVLDTAIDYFDFKLAKELFLKEAGATTQKQEILLKRSQIPLLSKATNDLPAEAEFPHQGHNSMRVGVAGAYLSDAGSSALISARFALHDLLDPLAGYPPYAQIEFFHLRLRYLSKGHRLWLDRFSAFEVQTLSPWKEYEKPLSWRFRLGAENLRDRNCNNCLAGIAEGGAGLALEFKNLTYFLFTEGEATGSPKLNTTPIRAGLGPRSGVRMSWTPFLQSLISAQYRYLFFMDEPHSSLFQSEHRWAFTKKWAINLKLEKNPRDYEIQSGLFFYF